ncbi:unnamed protein product [Amoebophrya sp. A120]|nr:unnamed protein product [Amoebophrya sp. A120]|eukprot:GSA120T00006666001.1
MEKNFLPEDGKEARGLIETSALVLPAAPRWVTKEERFALILSLVSPFLTFRELVRIWESLQLQDEDLLDEYILRQGHDKAFLHDVAAAKSSVRYQRLLSFYKRKHPNVCAQHLIGLRFTPDRILDRVFREDDVEHLQEVICDYWTTTSSTTTFELSASQVVTACSHHARKCLEFLLSLTTRPPASVAAALSSTSSKSHQAGRGEVQENSQQGDHDGFRNGNTNTNKQKASGADSTGAAILFLSTQIEQYRQKNYRVEILWRGWPQGKIPLKGPPVTGCVFLKNRGGKSNGPGSGVLQSPSGGSPTAMNSKDKQQHGASGVRGLRQRRNSAPEMVGGATGGDGAISHETAPAGTQGSINSPINHAAAAVVGEQVLSISEKETNHDDQQRQIVNEEPHLASYKERQRRLMVKHSPRSESERQRSAKVELQRYCAAPGVTPGGVVPLIFAPTSASSTSSALRRRPRPLTAPAPFAVVEEDEEGGGTYVSAFAKQKALKAEPASVDGPQPQPQKAQVLNAAVGLHSHSSTLSPSKKSSKTKAPPPPPTFGQPSTTTDPKDISELNVEINSIAVEVDAVDPGILILELYRRSEQDQTRRLRPLLEERLLERYFFSNFRPFWNPIVQVCFYAAACVFADAGLFAKLAGKLAQANATVPFPHQVSFTYASEKFQDWPLPVLVCRFSRDWKNIRDCLRFFANMQIAEVDENQGRDGPGRGTSSSAGTTNRRPPAPECWSRQLRGISLRSVTPRGIGCLQVLRSRMTKLKDFDVVELEEIFQHVSDVEDQHAELDVGVAATLSQQLEQRTIELIAEESFAQESRVAEAAATGGGILATTRPPPEQELAQALHGDNKDFLERLMQAPVVLDSRVTTVEYFRNVLDHGFQLKSADFETAMTQGRFDLLEFFKDYLISQDREEDYRKHMKTVHAKLRTARA